MGRQDEAGVVAKAACAARSIGPSTVVAADSQASCGAVGSNGDGGPGPGGAGLVRGGRDVFARVVSRATREGMARRLVAAGDAERERIERDIHDGVQQRLTALRIHLALAAERFQARGDAEASAALEGFGDDVEQAIDELRDLAHGIYPALLTSDGLGAALTSVGRHAAQPVTVRAEGVSRCRPAVEAAVYFACLAAFDNAAKHAGPARVDVELVGTSHGLRFTVCDSGAGFDMSRTPDGFGIANMRDRISAVGGTLTVESTPRHGTRVQGNVPDPWLHPISNGGRP